MDKRPISEMMETTMQKVRDMIDANTIIGDPIKTEDGVTLIPVSKLSFGFAGGGSDSAKKDNAFGGGIGAGVKVDPVAFVVVKGENITMMHITPPSKTTMDRIIETVPSVLEKVTDFLDKDKEEEN